MMKKKMCILFQKILYLFVVLFLWGSQSQGRSNLVISDIQIGQEESKTRVALILSQPVNLYARLESDSNEVIVESPEDTIWALPETLESDQGAFESYTLNTITDTPRTIRLKFKPVTKLIRSSVQPRADGSYQFSVDVITEEPPPPEPEPEQEPEHLSEDPQSVDSPPPPIIINPVVELPPPPKNSIRAVRVSEQKDKMTWVAITAKLREYFKFETFSQDKKILIYLPKTNWLEVDTRLKSSSLIRTYRVQDVESEGSIVILEAYKPIGVIDQFMSPNSDGSTDFVLIIADRPPTEEEKKIIQQKKEAELKLKEDREKEAFEKNLKQKVLTKDGYLSASNMENESSTVEAFVSNSSSNQTIPTPSDSKDLFDSESISAADLNEGTDVSFATGSSQGKEPGWVEQARQQADESMKPTESL